MILMLEPIMDFAGVIENLYHVYVKVINCISIMHIYSPFIYFCRLIFNGTKIIIIIIIIVKHIEHKSAG